MRKAIFSSFSFFPPLFFPWFSKLGKAPSIPGNIRSVALNSWSRTRSEERIQNRNKNKNRDKNQNKPRGPFSGAPAFPGGIFFPLKSHFPAQLELLERSV